MRAFLFRTVPYLSANNPLMLTHNEKKQLGPIAAALLAAYEKPAPTDKDWTKQRMAYNQTELHQ